MQSDPSKSLAGCPAFPGEHSYQPPSLTGKESSEERSLQTDSKAQKDSRFSRKQNRKQGSAAQTSFCLWGNQELRIPKQMPGQRKVHFPRTHTSANTSACTSRTYTCMHTINCTCTSTNTCTHCSTAQYNNTANTLHIYTSHSHAHTMHKHILHTCAQSTHMDSRTCTLVHIGTLSILLSFVFNLSSLWEITTV